MIRGASCGLLVLLAGAAGFGQTADVIREVTGFVQPMNLRPNALGGGPVAVPLAARQPRPPAPPPAPVDPLPTPNGPTPRPIRPVFTLPGAPKLDRHGDPLPSGAVARYGTVRLRHGTDIQGLGFTPDGNSLCTVSGSDDSVKMWDPVGGKEVARLHTAAQLVSLAKNGSVFIIDDTRVRVWLPAGNTVRDLPETTIPEGAGPTAIAVNPDGGSFALAVDGRVLLVDARSGKTLRELNLPGAPPNKGNGAMLALVPPGGPPPAGAPVPPPNRLVYSPDGRWLAGSGQKTGVWLWDLRTGKRVRTYRTELDFPEYAFSPDVTKIAVTGQQVHLYPLDSEEPVEGFKSPEDTIGFAPRFSPDGKTLSLVLGDGSVVLLDAATGTEKELLRAPEMNLHAPFALAPGGGTAAAIDPSGGIRVWDPKTGKGPEVARLPPLLNPGLSADGKSVTVLDQTNKVHTFDLATGAPGKVAALPGEDNGLPTAWDAASRRAAVTVPSGEDLEVQFTDDTGRVVSKVPLPQNSGIPIVSFAAANRDRAALFVQNTVIVVNPTTGKTVRAFSPGNPDNGFHGTISPDGRVTAVATHPLTVWEVATGKKRLTVDAIPRASEVAFSPDSRLLAAWDGAETVVVADVRTGTVVRRLPLPDAADGVSVLAVSPDA
ncbi:MAG: WD40 repeat domain-containing protein, partial [Planctomycetes bacterium]|nr:WD40 repeat domain-containing protein [Planctomycetota bacterium]